jgi:hypothetical protein
MAYKIANIKWLRDQGWSISSSYASGLCPSYNEIVNEIPKGSITVDVNRTCTATSKTYANNQLVCESDINISIAPYCEKYGWTASTLYEDAKDNVGGTVGISLSSAGTLVLYDKPNWVEYLTASTSQDVISYICKAKYNGGRPRSGDVIFRSPDGNCEFSSTVEQAAQVTPVNIMFTGLPSNLSSGNLIMTGSTYAADFTLAGPNAGNGTVYGVLDTTESRELMTFAGQFTTDTGGGGNIVNSCGGTSTSHMYTVLTASWNATTNTLNVTFGECT